jgi:hypothetical protein
MMRYLAPLILGLAVSACTAAPPAETAQIVAAQQAKLADLTAGKIAGQPQSCLNTYHQNDMVVIDDNTIAFRQGRQRVYVNHMMGPCSNLASGGNALVTKTTTTQLCRGDIAQIFDTSIKMTVGSCSFGDFVPYSAPGYRG